MPAMCCAQHERAPRPPPPSPPPPLSPPWNAPELSRGKGSQKDQQKVGCRVNQYEQLRQHQPRRYVVFSFCFSLSFLFSGLSGLCPPPLAPPLPQCDKDTPPATRYVAYFLFSQHKMGDTPERRCA